MTVGQVIFRTIGVGTPARVRRIRIFFYSLRSESGSYSLDIRNIRNIRRPHLFALFG
jgi:hypothetical protein